MKSIGQRLFGSRPATQAQGAGASLAPIFPFAAGPQPRPEDIGSLALSGTCPVCGQDSAFTGFTDNVRESGTCASCGSFNRQRQMAEIIRRRIGLGAASTLHGASGLAVYNTETTGALHVALSGALGDSYTCSEYFGEGFLPGQDVDGRRHENLQGLSFADASFDLVLSSDVLEHMPDPYLAHSEIFRVLRPGGRHLFTVPFDPGAALDDRRAKLVDGEVVYLAQKLFHGDPVRPDEGILVWTIFGLEMLVRMAEIGFRPTVWNLHEPARGIIGPHSIVFEALKPAT